MSTTFTDLGVPSGIVDALAARGLTAPFPIQVSTIAAALAGRDLCGHAPTGSGKTLAFAIPLAAKASKGRPGRPRALVLVPTRELAAQITEELRPLAAVRGRTVATFYGGTPISKDRTRLRRGVDIAVACPGRLADLERQGEVDLRDVGLVVLDEADRMADMGFLPEVRALLDLTSPDRQTLLFSATLDRDVDVLTRHYQRDPLRSELEEHAGEQGDVRHLFWPVERLERVELAALIVGAAVPAIVFTRTKHAADRVTRQLQRAGVTAAAIHGDRSQRQREGALADFMGGRVAALVATDVAARGLHIDDVAVVIHFDPPATGKDYVHRSGRTGRAGADGLVVTFVAPEQQGDVRSLQRALHLPQRLDEIAVEDLGHGVAGAARPPVHRPRRPQSVRTRQAASREGGRGRPQRRGQSSATASGSGSRRRGR